MSFLIDTDYVIDFLGGRPDAVALLHSLPREQIAIGVITFGEVTEGITFGRDQRRYEQGFRQFLRIAGVFPLNRTTMRQFARIRENSALKAT